MGQGIDSVRRISTEEKESNSQQKLIHNWGGLRADVIPKQPTFELQEAEPFRVTPQRPLQSHITGFQKLRW